MGFGGVSRRFEVRGREKDYENGALLVDAGRTSLGSGGHGKGG